MPSFVRHTFRGESNITGITKIVFPPGSKPSELNIPSILNRIYDENAMQSGLQERAQEIVSGRSIKEIITDLATERTFRTAEALAIKSGLNWIKGTPTVVNNNIDPVVSVPFQGPLEQVHVERMAEAELLGKSAREVAQSFMDNLQVNILPDDKPTIWSLLDLPDLTLLADTIVMAAGYPDVPLVKTLQDASWPRPKNPRKLVKQAQFLIGIEHRIAIPPGLAANYVAATPAKWILEHIQSDVVAVTHEEVITPLLAALGMGDLIFPLQEIKFELEQGKIKVTSIRFIINEMGNISTKDREEVTLSSVSLEIFERLSKMALIQPNRVTIPFNNDISSSTISSSCI